MLYHYTSLARWERIAADGEIKALSPDDPGYPGPKVVHLSVEPSIRGLPPAVLAEVIISIDERALGATTFLEWWSLELPLDQQARFEEDIRSSLGWPTRPEVHWYVVKGPVPASRWVEARLLADGSRLWPRP